MEFKLSAVNVSKKIKGRVLIDNMSFNICKGDICGFLGPNGAGKTTMIRLLTGLIKPDSGELLISGVDVNSDRKKALLNLGAIVETPVMFPYMTGRENLMNLVRLHPNISKRNREKRVEEVLKSVNLEKRADDKFSIYSLGMKQRLGIAQALLGFPEVIILDEPSNGLDPLGMKELRELILKLNNEIGITFLISSHLLDELQRICTSFVIINEGELKFEGTSEEFFRLGNGDMEDTFIKILSRKEGI